jgi:hypothetical protein
VSSGTPPTSPFLATTLPTQPQEPRPDRGTQLSPFQFSVFQIIFPKYGYLIFFLLIVISIFKSISFFKSIFFIYSSKYRNSL